MCEDVVSRFILVPLIWKELPLNKFLYFLSFGREKQQENNSVRLPYSRAMCLRGVMTNQPRNVMRYNCFKFYSSMIHTLNKLKEVIPCKLRKNGSYLSER